MQGIFEFLGCGGSAGVPQVGCRCAICSSSSPYDHRLRSSGLVTLGEKRFLIDVGPDFRAQALRANIASLDGLLLTHTHYDHIAGIDDLRVFYFLRGEKPLPCLLSKEAFEEVKFRYPYMFRPLEEGMTVAAQLSFQLIEGENLLFEGVKMRAISYFQSGMLVTGFRIGRFAYVTDIRDFDESIIASLQGLDLLILSALKKEVSPVHLNIEEAISFAGKVGAKKTYLTHLSHSLAYEEINRELPSTIRMGYDGCKIAFTY